MLVSACGADNGVDGDSGPTRRPSLVPIGNDQFGLGFGDSATLRVLYSDPDGQPIRGATVTFMLVATPPESDGGSTLGGAQSDTDAAGVATLTVTAGAAKAQFRVRAQAPNAAPALFYVAVSDQGFVSLFVLPERLGDRPVTRVEVRLYADIDCAALDPAAPPEAVYPPRTFDGYGMEATFTSLPLDNAYTVLGRATAGGILVAAGCAEIAPAQLLPGAEVHLVLPLADLPPTRAPSYAVSSTLDTHALIDDDTWRLAACPLGPAQLLLDCAIDELDGGDPADCVVENPGPLAQTLVARRGAPDATGCRPPTVAAAPSLDALAMTALAADGVALQRAAAGLPALTGSLALESTLGDVHTLVRARFSAGGDTHAVELLSSARPVVSAPAPALLDGSHVSFGEQRFTLRLGAAWREAFRALLWDRSPDALGDALGTDCGAVSDAACTGGCLLVACTMGASLLGTRLAQPFGRLDATEIDFRLVGTATFVDADGNGFAEGMAGGVWVGQVLVDGAWVGAPGTFAATGE